MVHLPTLEAMRKLYKDNMQQWIKEHPGEFVFIDGVFGGDITFYKSRRKLKKVTAKYTDRCGPTFLIEKIPVRTHRFNEDNKRLYFSKDFSKFCPNERKTKLVSKGGLFCYDEEGETFRNQAYCPDCGCLVFREKEIKRPIKNLVNKISNFVIDYSHRIQL